MQEDQYTQMLVPLGAQAKVVMPDGTWVHLNSGSNIRYSSNRQVAERKVFLEGEAYFEVARDPERPFVVHTNQLDVQVLGTKFNVKSYPEDLTVEVSLLGGKVDIQPRDMQEHTELLPDQCYILDKANNTYEVRQVDAQRSIAWIIGKITFINQTLVDILSDLERRKDVCIVLKTDKLQHEYFSGSIRADYTLNEALNFLDVDNKYTWERQGNTIAIRDK
ncbi:MAG: FecR domain-containing protein [Tannerellaceae bacterium]|nr:FecR domain-containing protein [Tannerellaceae bacterium]